MGDRALGSASEEAATGMAVRLLMAFVLHTEERCKARAVPSLLFTSRASVYEASHLKPAWGLYLAATATPKPWGSLRTQAKDKQEKKKEKKEKKDKKEKKSKKRERGSDSSSDEGEGRAAKRSRYCRRRRAACETGHPDAL
jgi:hypothetical protein